MVGVRVICLHMFLLPLLNFWKKLDSILGGRHWSDYCRYCFFVCFPKDYNFAALDELNKWHTLTQMVVYRAAGGGQNDKIWNCRMRHDLSNDLIQIPILQNRKNQ